MKKKLNSFDNIDINSEIIFAMKIIKNTVLNVLSADHKQHINLSNILGFAAGSAVKLNDKNNINVDQDIQNMTPDQFIDRLHTTVFAALKKSNIDFNVLHMLKKDQYSSVINSYIGFIRIAFDKAIDQQQIKLTQQLDEKIIELAVNILKQNSQIFMLTKTEMDNFPHIFAELINYALANNQNTNDYKFLVMRSFELTIDSIIKYKDKDVIESNLDKYFFNIQEYNDEILNQFVSQTIDACLNEYIAIKNKKIN